jgi:hypothetical protein
VASGGDGLRLNGFEALVDRGVCGWFAAVGAGCQHVCRFVGLVVISENLALDTTEPRGAPSRQQRRTLRLPSVADRVTTLQRLLIAILSVGKKVRHHKTSERSFRALTLARGGARRVRFRCSPSPLLGFLGVRCMSGRARRVDRRRRACSVGGDGPRLDHRFGAACVRSRGRCSRVLRCVRRRCRGVAFARPTCAAVSGVCRGQRAPVVGTPQSRQGRSVTVVGVGSCVFLIAGLVIAENLVIRPDNLASPPTGARAAREKPGNRESPRLAVTRALSGLLKGQVGTPKACPEPCPRIANFNLSQPAQLRVDRPNLT